MKRVYPAPIYGIVRTERQVIAQCGSQCGHWCSWGNRCNYAGDRRQIPDPLPESGFPDFCQLVKIEPQAELFLEVAHV